ncbi:MAG: hypothetical protein IJ489_08895 [Clostridia bacterium]|nr:hypothetical protein [Clostridia bacterium]
MNNDIFSESSDLYPILEKIISKIVADKTRSCFRVYKASVVSVPNGTTVGISLIGEKTVLNLPYSSAISEITVGDFVWVGVIFNNFRNAFVWQKANFN